MAKLYPDFETIKKLRVKPTEGEWTLLEFLFKNLDDNYEIYFQPYLNGDNPDIILLRENAGAMIIEVKDWVLDHYTLNEKNNWVLKNIKDNLNKRVVIKSPFQQVFEYKENLFNLHIEPLLERRIKDPRSFNLVSCAVYFHNATFSEMDNFQRDNIETNDSYKKFLSHFEIIGKDGLNSDNFNSILKKKWLDRSSRFFDDILYKSFQRYLQPTNHMIEQGIDITYTAEQKKIIESRPYSKQKVKGVAGCGKTLTLAKRAVNAHLRHGGRVLILTFNISLRNYIHDKINEVRENFEWKYFTILHYHQFIKSHTNNECIVPVTDDDIIPEHNLFHTLIIDEVQDYTKEWISNVRKFLTDDGEYVVFGDEKQNIYQRELEEKKPYTGIPGNWSLLKRSFRISSDIANLATKFQLEFFQSKYDLDEMIITRDVFDRTSIQYYYLDNYDLTQILNWYQDVILKTASHDNDICIQSAQVELLRPIDFAIRSQLNKNTKTMFETQEIYDKLQNEYSKEKDPDSKKFKRNLDTIRRGKKFNFWMNTGTNKLTTIHSFKGWEINTLFLIIDSENSDENEFTTDELIYTAITRCKQNLIIINIANHKYDSFFKKEII